MKRKILFVLFAEDSCRQHHAFWYAMDLHRHGHEVRLVLEGGATQLLAGLEDPSFELGPAIREAAAAGVLAGTCRRASLRCDGRDDTSPATQAAEKLGVPLLADLGGHAGIEPFVRDGYELVMI